jgi:hypothetical protein
MAIKQEVIDCYQTANISEDELEAILTATTEELYYDNETQY